MGVKLTPEGVIKITKGGERTIKCNRKGTVTPAIKIGLVQGGILIMDCVRDTALNAFNISMTTKVDKAIVCALALCLPAPSS